MKNVERFKTRHIGSTVHFKNRYNTGSGTIKEIGNGASADKLLIELAEDVPGYSKGDEIIIKKDTVTRLDGKFV